VQQKDTADGRAFFGMLGTGKGEMVR